MNKLFTVFSIIFISFNINDLNASDFNNNFNENRSLTSHQRYLRNIHDIVWDRNLSNVFENISNKFKNNPYELETYYYAREIITRMIKDENFKTQFTLNSHCNNKMKYLLLHYMSFHMSLCEYLNNNSDNKLLKEFISNDLSNFGYDRYNDDFDEYVEKCLNLYDELKEF